MLRQVLRSTARRSVRRSVPCSPGTKSSQTVSRRDHRTTCRGSLSSNWPHAPARPSSGPCRRLDTEDASLGQHSALARRELGGRGVCRSARLVFPKSTVSTVRSYLRPPLRRVKGSVMDGVDRKNPLKTAGSASHIKLRSICKKSCIPQNNVYTCIHKPVFLKIFFSRGAEITCLRSRPNGSILRNLSCIPQTTAPMSLIEQPSSTNKANKFEHEPRS